VAAQSIAHGVYAGMNGCGLRSPTGSDFEYKSWHTQENYMKPIIRNLTLASSILFLSVSAFAQHTPRSHGSGSAPPREQSQRETESVTGTVKEIEASALVLEDRKGDLHRLAVTGETKFETSRGQAVQRLSDLAVGRKVRVTFRPRDRVAVEVKGTT
jgi:hypothetical protein